jgi:hypothetical protein
VRHATASFVIVGRALLVASLAVAVSARGARASGGVRAGIALASLQNVSYPSDRRIGIHAGVFEDFGLSSSFAVRVEMAYVMKGVKPSDLGRDVTLALDYLELPVLAKVSIPAERATPVLLAGLAPAIKLGAEARVHDGPHSSYGDLVHSFDFGWVVGAGIDVPAGSRFIQLDVRYTRGLRAVFDFDDPQDTDSDDKNEVISAGIGITL